jgi:hypothetical protein
MPHTISSLLILLLFLSGCGGGSFLNNDLLKSFTREISDSHRLIYFDRTYSQFEKSTYVFQTHYAIQVGKNTRTSPEVLSVSDGSVDRLIAFAARVIRVDGSSDSYGKSDLSSLNLSGRIISESMVKYLPIEKSLKAGEIVEIQTRHLATLGPLGINFSLQGFSGPAANITCRIEVPRGDELEYKVVNDSLVPRITLTESGREYSFSWKEYTPLTRRATVSKKNSAPGILARVRPADSRSHKDAWQDFGDWYLSLIETKLLPDERISKLAADVTQGKETGKEKMDAIFEYCQRNVRYEQVYFAQGEFIPNDVATVFSRKYGDCKDYSSLIVAMGRSVGLEPTVALCYRGRGVEFQEDMAVSQFNHLIAYYQEDGKDFWYDGTNRTGLPGITTKDLVNGTALVIDQKNSRLVRIREGEENLLHVSGTLKAKGTSAGGTLAISLYSQYAIDLFWMAFHLNEEEMRNTLKTWVRSNINENMNIRTLTWKVEGSAFHMEVSGEIPNCLTRISPYYYVSFSRLIDMLLPTYDIDEEELFYFPYYNRVKVRVGFDNLRIVENSLNEISFQCVLPPGPYTEVQRKEFLEAYRTVQSDFKKTHKCTSPEEPL